MNLNAKPGLERPVPINDGSMGAKRLFSNLNHVELPPNL
jgi:hypothetical protein